MKKVTLLFICLLATIISGCSSSNNDAPLLGSTPSASSVHVAGWLSAHGDEASVDLRGCQGCHGFDFKGSGNAVSCFNCHSSGPPFVGAHPSSWNADPYNAHRTFANATDPNERLSWTVCANAACHGADLNGGASVAPSCMIDEIDRDGILVQCHPTAEPPPPHVTPFPNSLHGPAAKGATDPNLSMGTYCINCHGRPDNTFDGGFVADPGILGNANGNCGTCHTTATAHPANWTSIRTGNNVNHNDGSLTDAIKNGSCALCHTTSGQAPPSPFTGAPTCFADSYSGLACHATGPGGAPHDTLATTGVDYLPAGMHGPAAKAGMAGCQLCHATAGAAGSNPRFNIAKGTMVNGCEDCHVAGAHPTGTDRWTFNLDTTHAVTAETLTRRTHFATASRVSSDCVLCHNVNDTDSGTGTAKACNTCHASTTTFSLNCTYCHETPPATGTPNLTGATFVDHAAGTDVTLISNHEDCSICHGASESGTAAGTLQAKSADYLLFGGSGQGGDHLDGLIEVNTAVGYQDATASVVAERFGCTAACHPNDTTHQLSDGGLGTEAGNYTGGTIACNDCHGYPPAGVTAAPGASPASHMGSDSGVTLLANHGECQTCHGTKDSGAGSHEPLTNYTAATDHYNGQINMNSTTGYNATNGGCDNAVCHPNDTAHRVPPTSGLTVLSGDYGAGSCSSCHDYPPKGDKIPLTAPGTTTSVSHLGSDGTGAILLANHSDCQVCHGTKDTAGSHDPVSPYVPGTHHRDNQVQMNSDTGYNATTFGCDTAGCHANDTSHRLSSSAPGLSVDLLALGASGACDSCHGGLPTDTTPITSNAHTAHLSSTIGVSLTCDTCHGHLGIGPTHNQGSGTVLAANVDVPFAGIAAGGTYSGPGTKQCSNVYCHGSSNTADWDAGTGGACGDCHGAPITGRPDGVNEPGGGNHQSSAHAAAACTTCHPHAGTDTTNHINGAANANADAQISTAGAIATHSYGATLGSSPDPDGFKYSASTCTTSCHGSAVWGGSGGCNFCHGYPPTSTGTNNKHALGVTAVNHDLLRDTSSLANGLGGFLILHDNCSYCHGVKDSGSGTMTAMAPSVLGGTYTYLEGTDHQDGNVTMNGPTPSTGAGYNSTTGACDNSNCHSNDAAHRLGSGSTVQARNFGPGLCSSCHNTGVGGAPVITSSSPHVATTVGGSFNACEDCHSGHVGTGGVTIELPPANWTNAAGESHVTGDMQAALGIAYTSHNGINLGGPGTVSAINTQTTEAEICWGCHDAAGIGEFKTGAGATFKFGRLATAKTGGSDVSDWTTAGAWRQDADDARLSRPLASIHTVNLNGTAGHSASASANVTGGKVDRGSLNSALPGFAANAGTTNAVTLEDKQYIRCSYCHDVHDTKGPTGAPYLRGTWTSDPYPTDIPPGASETWGVSANAMGTKMRNLGGMPRPKAAANTGGGFFIDVNSGTPTDLAATDTLAETGGLCTLCHGSNVNAMDYYTGSSLWRSGNGHANSTLGGDGTGKINLFDPDRGGTSWPMAMQDEIGQKINSNSPPWGKNLVENDRVDISGWYSSYNAWYQDGDIGNRPNGTTAHNFTCSKCHSPHATGLPVLLKTNCLDVNISKWTNPNNTRVNYSIQQANNCHRKESTATGWHNLDIAQ